MSYILTVKCIQNVLIHLSLSRSRILQMLPIDRDWGNQWGKYLTWRSCKHHACKISLDSYFWLNYFSLQEYKNKFVSSRFICHSTYQSVSTTMIAVFISASEIVYSDFCNCLWCIWLSLFILRENLSIHYLC